MISISHQYTNRRTHLKRNNLWVPGEILTEKDLELLRPIIEKYNELKRTPTRAEVPENKQIKLRFRTWADAIQAAGLPSLSDPEQMKLRNNNK